MLLREYLQTQHSLSRRKFTVLVDQWQVFLNNVSIESYKHEIKWGEQIMIKSWKYRINEKIKISDKKVDPIIVLFNKPKWYVVSKWDNHNDTIYGILPKKLHSYYYIWRLDKESHGLLLLTNDPKLVHKWEHPKFEIEKEYIVELDRSLEEADKEKVLMWVTDEWDLLRATNIEVKKPTIVHVILREWKKRHIRRMFRALWYRVWDLQRIREGEYVLWDIKMWEWEEKKV